MNKTDFTTITCCSWNLWNDLKLICKLCKVQKCGTIMQIRRLCKLGKMQQCGMIMQIKVQQSNVIVLRMVNFVKCICPKGVSKVSLPVPESAFYYLFS